LIRIFSILDGYKVLKFQVNLNIFFKSGKNYPTPPQRRRLRYVPEWETPTWPPSIQMGVTAAIFLASILLKEMRYLVYIRYLWLDSVDFPKDTYPGSLAS
jgi:hypothetical protein